MLEINNLTFSYGRNDIFKDTSFTAYNNCITVIKGESGSGKSTLLDIISLKYRLTSQYTYNEEDIDVSFKDNIAYIQQSSILADDLRIKDQWHLLMKLYNNNFELDNYIERLQMKSICNLYPQQLSGGERQRVLLINALIISKPVIILDEPTASINEELKIELVEILEENKRNHIIIVSTHDSCFDSADGIYEIKDKKIVCIKDSHTENGDIKISSNYKKINWISYFIKMKEHHIFKNIISFMIISFIICSFCYVTFMNNGFVMGFTSNLSNKETNSFIVYKALNPNYPSLEYDRIGNFPITESELKEINEIEYIENLTTKYIIPAYNYDTKTGTFIPKDMMFKSNDKEIKFYNTDSIYFEVYDFSKEYSNITYFSNQKEGVYINSKLLESLELSKEDIKDCRLSITVSIPIFNQTGTFNMIEYNDGLSVPYSAIITKPIKLEVPVLGVIEEDLINTVTPNTQQILITFDTIDNLIIKNKTNEIKTVYYSNKVNDYVDKREEATETLVYTPYEPNAYVVTVDSIEHVREVVEKLKDMGYTVQSDYFEYEMIGNSIINTKESLQLWSVIISSIVFILICIKQFFRNESEKTLNQWMKIIGITDRKEHMILKTKKYILDLCLSLFISMLMLSVMIFATLPLTGNIYDFDIMMILVLIGISLLIYIGIPVIWEVTYDRS